MRQVILLLHLHGLSFLSPMPSPYPFPFPFSFCPLLLLLQKLMSLLQLRLPSEPPQCRAHLPSSGPLQVCACFAALWPHAGAAACPAAAAACGVPLGAPLQPLATL